MQVSLHSLRQDLAFLAGEAKIPTQPDSDQIMLLLVNERVAHCK